MTKKSKTIKELKKFMEERFKVYTEEENMSITFGVGMVDYECKTGKLGIYGRFLLELFCCEKSITAEKIRPLAKECFLKYFTSIDIKKFKRYMTNEEYIHCQKRVAIALAQLKIKKTIEITKVCYYYSEMTNKINDYCKTINMQNKTADEVLKKIFYTYFRSITNTKSEEITMKVTAIENIEARELYKGELFNKTIKEIGDFDVEDIKNKHEKGILDQDEIENLLERINYILKTNDEI